MAKALARHSLSSINLPIDIDGSSCKMVSYGSTTTIFSNKYLYPAFLRTVPTDPTGVYAIVSLLRRFSWTWIGVLCSDDDAGILGSELLMEEVKRSGGCIAFSERVSMQHSGERARRLVDLIERSTANVIVVYSHVGFMVPIFEMLAQRKVTGKVWLGSPAFIITPDLFTKPTWESLNGTMAIAFHDAAIPGFKEFVHSIHPSTSPGDIFIKPFWEKVFRCTWHNTNDSQAQGDEREAKSCTGTEEVSSLDPALFHLDSLRYAYNVYLAVYAFAHALHDLMGCQSQDKKVPQTSCLSIKKPQPRQVLHHLRKVHFVTSSGEEVFFDENGDPPAVYDFLNWRIFPDGSYRLVTIAKFDERAPPGQEITFNTEVFPWNASFSELPKSVCSVSCTPGFRKAPLQGQPGCCYDCVPCDNGEISNETDATACTKCREQDWPNERRDECKPRIVEFLSYEEPLGLALSSLSTILSLVTISILCIFVRHRDTPIVKANNRELSYLLLGSLLFCFLCSFMFIGRPKKWTCMFRQMAFGLIFSLSISCVLGKTIMVTVAFRATKPNSQLKKWVGSRTPTYLVLCCLMVQLVICTAWLATDPPFPGYSTAGMKIIIQCYEGSVIMFYCMLGYLGFLAGASFIVAFLSRKLPDSFNEAKFITFSLLVFLSVWLSFIPAYLSTQGKYMVAVETFAILASSSGLLSCIFFPKMFIILLRPDMNSKGYLFGKMHKKDKLK
ncbi:extracellular calcium-sensing receptor-like [Ambystoma mexicanum]|uniref:extracellular calcium-sensing receptor-like n=1 Tax=Ambystoma mexicanum TaxID=8296 RepID=UPI0037E7F9B7